MLDRVRSSMNAVGLTFNELSHEKIIFIPIGSFECHGKMLPLATDSLIAIAFCLKFAQKIKGVVLPCIHYTPCATTLKLQGTIHVTNDHFKMYLSDVCIALWNQGFKKIVLVNIHSGCDSILKVLVEELFVEKRMGTFYFNPFQSGAAELDRTIFQGKDRSYKECSLLLAALKILGEETILNRMLNQKVDEKQKRDIRIEKIREYATIGFYYDRPADHVAGRTNLNIDIGLKYYEKQSERFVYVIRKFEK